MSYFITCGASLEFVGIVDGCCINNVMLFTWGGLWNNPGQVV